MKWIQYSTPDGQPYYYNVTDKTTTYEKPTDGIILDYKQLKQERQVKEQIVALKRIPKTKWAIVLTNQDHEFYFDVDNIKSYWEIPDDLALVINEMMNPEEILDQLEPMPIPPEAESTIQPVVEVVQQIEVKPEIPIKERMEIFKKMLFEYNTSPYSTWEKEMLKFEEDERFNILSGLKEKKKAFDAYCKEKVKELKDLPQKPKIVSKEEPVQQKRKEPETLEPEDIKRKKRELALKERMLQLEKEKMKLNRQVTGTKKRTQKEESQILGKTLFMDTVKDIYPTFDNMLQVYEKEYPHRWELITKHLSIQEIQELFQEHLENVWKKQVSTVEALLDRTLRQDERLVIPWQNIWHMIKKDARISKIVKNSNDQEDIVFQRLKEWFVEWQQQQLEEAKLEFKKAVEQGSFVNTHLKSTIERLGKVTPEQVYAELKPGEMEASVMNDQRYIVLEKFPVERKRIIGDYIKETVEKLLKFDV